MKESAKAFSLAPLPLVDSPYNRSPILTPEEKNGLRQVQAMPHRTGHSPLHVRSIRRLMLPLLDAMDVLNIHQSVVSRLIRQICPAMLWLNKA